MKKFVIFGCARSGTVNLSATLTRSFNLVQEPAMLNSGDNHLVRDIIKKYGNIYKDAKYGEFNFPNGRLATKKFHSVIKDASQSYQFLDDIYERFSGIKHVYSSAPDWLNTNFVKYFRDRSVKVIFLKREDIFATALSSYFKQRDDRCSFVDIDNLKELIEVMRYRTVYNEQLIKEQISDDNLLPYCYEDLYARETETREKNLETICDFVGIERSYLHEEMVQEKFLTKLEKNRKDKYKQIKNYEEVMNLKNEM
tara:strand:+ start:1296 stop:2057 length:762 start_codon:yes stop_codon:yes gene_type:complete